MNPPPQRIALRKGEAAKSLGISDESFDRYVAPFIKVARLGALRLYPVGELQRWIETQASAPLEDS